MNGNILQFHEGDIIFKEDEPQSDMYVVTEGFVELYMNYGTPNVHLLGIRGKGKSFGEIGFFCNDGCFYTAVAYGDVEVVQVTEENLVEYIYEYPESVIGLFKRMAGINKMLKSNLEMMISEVHDRSEYLQRNEEMRRQIARYSVRGIFGSADYLDLNHFVPR